MRKLSFIRKKIKDKIIFDSKGFGISESILSILLLSIITTFALYFVSLRQQNLYKANLNKAIDDEIRRDIEKLKTELWHEHYHEPRGKGYGEYKTTGTITLDIVLTYKYIFSVTVKGYGPRH